MSFLIESNYQVQKQVIFEDHILQKVALFIINTKNAVMVSKTILNNSFQQINLISMVYDHFYETITFQWKLTRQKYGVKFKMTPNSITNLGINVIIRNQRSLVDIHYKISQRNKTLLNKYKFLINQNDRISIESYNSFQNLINAQTFILVMNRLLNQMPKLMYQQLSFIFPYICVGSGKQNGHITQQINDNMKQQINDNMKQQINDNMKYQKNEKQQMNNKIKKFIVLHELYRQNRRISLKFKQQTFNTNFSSNQSNDVYLSQYNQIRTINTINNKINQDKKKLYQPLKIIFPSLVQNIINDNTFGQQVMVDDITELIVSISNLSYQNQKKRQKQNYRNVYGISHVKTIKRQKKLKSNGNHSAILIGKYSFIISPTLHMSTQKSLSQQIQRKNQVLLDKSRPHSDKRQVYDKPNQGLRHVPHMAFCSQLINMNLIKKKLLSSQNICHENSFRNQIQFLYFVKDKFCPSIATYYCDSTVGKSNINEILIDRYPRNLYQYYQQAINNNFHFKLQNKIQILNDILQCLSFLARNKICHRDIKMENIMLTKYNSAKIIDFGSCCQAFGLSVFVVKDTRLLTTQYYSLKYQQCPQQIRQKYKKKQFEQHLLFDVYSFGKIMQILLQNETNLYVYNIENYENLANQRQIQNRISILSLLHYIKQKCIQIDPVDRLTFQEITFLFFEIQNIISVNQDFKKQGKSNGKYYQQDKNSRPRQIQQK